MVNRWGSWGRFTDGLTRGFKFGEADPRFMIAFIQIFKNLKRKIGIPLLYRNLRLPFLKPLYTALLQLPLCS